MCRTAHALLSTGICGIQMLVRVFMTIILMVENLIRMILQTLYNFISFMLQMLSLIPICVVFLLTARLKCFMCGGGGPCPVNRGGACDCLMSAAGLIILFFIFRATGVLDKIFYKIGYVHAPPIALVRFVPTPGDITECSRNDSMLGTTTTGMPSSDSDDEDDRRLRYNDYTTETETMEETVSTTTLATVQKAKVIKHITRQMKVKSSVKRAKIAPEHFLLSTEVTRTTDATKNTDVTRTIDFTITRVTDPASTVEFPLLVALTQRMNVTKPPPVDTETDVVKTTFSSNMTTVLYYMV